MIQKPKKQLFNSPPFIIAILLAPLVCFFIYGTFIDAAFLYYLSIGLLGCIIFLIPQNFKLSKTKASGSLNVQDVHEQNNLIQSEIDDESQKIESFRKKIINFSQLKGVTERLGMCLTLEDTSNILSAEVNRLYGEDDTTIILYLFHSKTGELGISSSKKGQMRVNLKSKKGDLFDRWVVKTMQSLLIEDTKSDYRFDIDKVETDDARAIRSIISVPLCVANKALGILRIDSPKENYFDTEDLRFLTTVGDLGALAIENAQLYERVKELAIRDSLTNLYLRRYLQERLPEEISRHLRREDELSFMLIDLDHFKKYNDKYGHIAGDIVLKTVSNLLRELFSEPGSLVCRYGGEEFCVLLPECSKREAKELAEKVRSKIAEKVIILRRKETSITASIGIATFPKDAKMKEDLIHKADQALYKAKEKGRNQVCAA